MGKHTQAFNEIMGNSKGIFTVHDVNFATSKSFVDRMSRELTDEVVNRIIKEGASKNPKYITNNEIWAFCKNNLIEPDLEEGQQGMIDFEEPQPKEEVKVDYAALEEYDDFMHEGEECFVVSNDSENQLITFRNHDTMEKGTINY
jgi:hypothetical protein